MKIRKRILIGVLLFFVVLQFFQPKKNNGDLEAIEPFLNETNPSKNVQGILKRACYDCHSDSTNYPWYAQITPINFWLENHINHGKENLNFSKWNQYSSKRKEHKLDEIIELVEQGKMPLESYTLVHKDAILNDVQIEQIKQWAEWAKIQYILEQKPQ